MSKQNTTQYFFDPDKEFFVLHSDDLEGVRTSFYGYGFSQTGVVLSVSDLPEGGN